MSLTRTETLDLLYTSTFSVRKPKVVDNFFGATPFWYYISKKGHITFQNGGSFIETPINYGKNETVTFIGKGGTVSLADSDTVTVATANWRMAAVNVTRYGTDDLKNTGESAVLNMVTTKLDNARNSLADQFEETLLGDGTGFSGQAWDGLDNLIAEDPTATATIQGIPQGTYSWWRNSSKDMTGESCAVYLIKRMRTMFNDCGKNSKGLTRFPDLIISDQTTNERYEDEALELYQVTDTKLADMGFGEFAFKGKPMTWSPSCKSGSMYFLNMSDLYMAVHPDSYFAMTDWKQVANQPNDRFAQICLYGNLVISNRRRQGVIFNIDTD